METTTVSTRAGFRGRRRAAAALATLESLRQSFEEARSAAASRQCARIGRRCARIPCRCAPAIAASELWEGLLAGRWSLVDRHDENGRRYYLAVGNPAEVARTRALTEIEARVVEQVVAGEPNKVIAYALGLAESTVAGYLAAACRKIGAGDRMELIRLGRLLARA